MKDNFNGTLIVKNDEYNLAFAEGNIKGTTFPDGITFMEFNVIFYEDVRLSIESLSTSPIFFAYCSQGSLQHSFGEQGEKKRIKKQYSGILKSAARVNSILHFEKHIPIEFSVISIGTNTSVTQKNAELVNKLKNTFFNTKEDYLNVRVQNSKIADKIKGLNTLTQNGNVGNVLKNRILGNILEMEIEQNTDGFSEIADEIYSFTIKRIDEIKSATRFVINLPGEFAIKLLELKRGFFTNKLQEGFRLISSRTIQNFLIFMKN
ncbi:MAG: hypothetical protein H7Y10_01715 [Flavobacterium sp.]|nr:hypothetical protein [Flavobacterium sp.]